MSLRIACDLDGTVADMDAALQREANRLFGPAIQLHTSPDERLASAEDVAGHIQPGAAATVAPPLIRALSQRQLSTLWHHVAQVENFWISLSEIEPGVVARLSTLAKQRRWEIIFLTQRPAAAGATTQVQSQRWLQAHGFELPSVMVMRGSRGKVAAALALDVVIDDRPENCLDVLTDSQAHPLLIWRSLSEAVPAGIAGLPIQRLGSMADAIAVLESMTTNRERGHSLMGRLKRAFGSRP